MKNQVIVLDFGGQYTQLIARRVREEKVYCQVLSGDATVEEIKKAVDPVQGDVPAAIIFSGGPDSVYIPTAVLPDKGIFELGVPILGICYGMQAMAKVLGGRVIAGTESGGREYGPAEFTVKESSGILKGLGGRFRVIMSHGDAVETPPPGFDVLGSTEKTPVAAMGDPARRFYGVQFHPEVKHTENGRDILGNFLFHAAGMTPDWTTSQFIESSVARIRATVGDAKVISGVSGGVDSTVATVLVHKAVGDNLHCVLVDHGLLRKDEAKYVVASLAKLGIKVNLVNAQDRFLNALKGVTDPEKKRKIIGEEFIRVFEEEARKFGDIEYFVQGTIYPDVIESGSRLRAVIKSHHNVGGLPERMHLKLIEPIRELFKDEVRLVGRELGLPAEFINRHPFPGPGLGVRVLGEVTRDKLDTLREAQAILDEEIRAAGLYEKLWQAFCVIPGVRTVGVMGDSRTFGHLIAIRAVESEDAMTAHWAKLPYDLLERVSSRIVNEVQDVNRVVLDITSKPPSTIEWE
ncbi:MAG TPA: glutamine-hydrolyzing GMP synthase [Firmicutes bacterium]|nr:glutamine-hydrolyzing GMP synthase [Candidatus Fermentithermobacillaceae bacterium]